MSKRIWIVDDDEGILDAVEIVLRQEGYETEQIKEPADVPQRLETEPHPELILLDILMSGVDGRDISQTLKKNEKTKHIPILIMTANIHAEKRFEEAGADGLIKKPFDIDDLIAKVRQFAE
jgi:DNA-binding response OmpR family regulator